MTDNEKAREPDAASEAMRRLKEAEKRYPEHTSEQEARNKAAYDRAVLERTQ